MRWYHVDFAVMGKTAGGDQAFEHRIGVVHQILYQPVGNAVPGLPVSRQ